MVMFWVTLLAVSILIYVLLDGFDLGVGMLFGLAGEEPRRRVMISAVAPVWDGNETWLVVSGVILWGAFPVVYSVLMSAFYLPVLLMLAGLILRGVSFEFRNKAKQMITANKRPRDMESDEIVKTIGKTRGRATASKILRP